MVAIKAHQASSFLKSPDPRLTAFLFFGPDAGLVSERAASTAKTLANRDTPAGEILRLDELDLDGDPDRLAVELRTLPMFGGKKIIRTTAGRKINAALLADLVKDDNLSGCLIVEAGNLKPADKLRKLFEAPTTAAAIACFPDAAKDLDAVVDEVLSVARQTIDAEARALLISRLGADRALSRGEIEKLSLYTHGKKNIDRDDVDAIVGDASEMAFDRVLMATASGKAETAIAEYNRTIASGESPQALIAAAGRHFHRLHRVKSEIEKGQQLEAALRQLRPPLHFKQRDAFSAQCRNWPAKRLTQGLDLIGKAALSARRSHQLEGLIAERLLMNLSRLAGR